MDQGWVSHTLEKIHVLIVNQIKNISAVAHTTAV
jgi:hypothetical protein